MVVSRTLIQSLLLSACIAASISASFAQESTGSSAKPKPSVSDPLSNRSSNQSIESSHKPAGEESKSNGTSDTGFDETTILAYSPEPSRPDWFYILVSCIEPLGIVVFICCFIVGLLRLSYSESKAMNGTKFIPFVYSGIFLILLPTPVAMFFRDALQNFLLALCYGSTLTGVLVVIFSAPKGKRKIFVCGTISLVVGLLIHGNINWMGSLLRDIGILM